AHAAVPRRPADVLAAVVSRRTAAHVVDRRFDRARYDAERVIAQFSVQLREQVDLDVLGTDLLSVVHQVLAPAHLTLWLSDTVGSGGRAGADESSRPGAPVGWNA